MAFVILHGFRYEVKVLEGRDRIGGRVWDDSSLGACVGKGAQIITGQLSVGNSTNTFNPLSS